jgi:sugar phosphate isomerase/epimerase
VKISITVALAAGKRAPILFRGSMEEAFDLASRLGYGGVEIHLLHPDDIDKHRVKELCLRHSLEIPTIGTGMAAGIEGLTFTDPDPGVRAKAVDRILRQIDLAAYLGSAVTIGLIYGSLGSDSALLEVRREAAMQCLVQCCRHAETKQVTLFLEAINRYELDQHNTVEEVIERIKKVGSRNLKLLADTFHMNIEEVDIKDSLRKAAEHLGHVHLADSNRQAPGHGHSPLHSVVNTLKQIRFQGHIAFEILPLPNPEQAAQDGIACVRKLLESQP